MGRVRPRPIPNLDCAKLHNLRAKLDAVRQV
jgi:hypothetical protein